VKTSRPAALLAASIAAILSGCSKAAAGRAAAPVRTAEIRYDKAQETDRYFGSVQARYEVDQALRVGGKIVARKIDVGQKVRQGDVLAVLDDTDYRLAVQAAQQQLVAAEAQARQAQSDRQRLDALKATAR
jgi:multidrug efflux pump subunit AcrA (membrane-fusion protein)